MVSMYEAPHGTMYIELLEPGFIHTYGIQHKWWVHRAPFISEVLRALGLPYEEVPEDPVS